jgi:hypothetical protein
MRWAYTAAFLALTLYGGVLVVAGAPNIKRV